MSTPAESSARPATSAPLLGFWYPALLATAVPPGKMRAQMLLGLPLLICRDSQGRLAALRDICPHRGMPLSFGHFDGDRLECCYHGWQFDMEGRCRHIPALVAGSPLQVDKIGVTTYPCEERDGYVWVYLADSSEKTSAPPEVPRLPLLSARYRRLHLSTALPRPTDDGTGGRRRPAARHLVPTRSWTYQ